MEFRILGPLDVVDGARSIDLLAGRQRLVLGLLALNAGAIVSTDELVAALWSSAPPRNATAALRIHVSRLRSALDGFVAGAGEIVSFRQNGYLLAVELEDVDAGRFRAGVRRAAVSLAAGDRPGAERHLATALALWRGEVLEEFALSAVEHPGLTALHEGRVRAFEQLADLRLAFGRYDEVVVDLLVMAERHPLRERLCAQRMVALYGCGRQADALAVYQEVRRGLVNELGLEPGPELRALESAILRHEPVTGLLAADRSPGLIGGPLTFLLTDIAGSAAAWERNPAVMASAVARHETIIAEAVRSSGGTLVRSRGEGDSTFSVFENPAAAVAAAVEAQRSLGCEPWPADARLLVRMAVHLGRAEARDGDHYGPTVNRTSRIRGLAHGGQVLCSAAVAGAIADELPNGATLVDVGVHVLRDLRRPERIHEVRASGLLCGFPPLNAGRCPSNLPADPSPFIGRAEDLAQVEALLEERRLVTLTGAGGSGKTRLAIRAAARMSHRFPDGVWLVQLAGIDDGRLVPALVADAVGVQEHPGVDLVATLVDQLAVTSALIVLDNCEHVLVHSAALVERLLAGCRELHVLATSRERLAATGECTWAVLPLSLPVSTDNPAGSEAVQLFIDRAKAVQPGFVLDAGNAADVAATCVQLDGLPLAIELAAARLAVLTPAQLRARLDDRFDLLTSGSTVRAPRQQTLRALVDWSYELLAEDDQALFRRASVFRNGFTLEAAELVLQDPAGPPVLDGLARLVDKSLVTRPSDGSRFRLLETLRTYGQGRCSTHEAETVGRRHADWCQGLVESWPAVSDRSSTAATGVPLAPELANLRAALGWAVANSDVDRAQRLAADLAPVWQRRGDVREGAVLLEEVLRAGDGADAVTRGRVLAALGSFEHLSGNSDSARHHLEAALAIGRSTGDGRLTSVALVGLGELGRLNDPATTTAHLKEALAAAKSAGANREAGVALVHLALAAEDPEEKRAYFAAAIEMARRSDDAWVLARAKQLLADVTIDIDRAVALREEALTSFRHLGDNEHVAHLDAHAGIALATAGNSAEAAVVLTGALDRMRATRNHEALALQLYWCGIGQHLLGDDEVADALLDECQELVTARRAPVAMAMTAWAQAFVDLDARRDLAAAAHLASALATASCLPQRVLTRCVLAVATLAVRHGDAATAVVCAGAALAGLRQGASWIRDDDNVAHQRQVSELKLTLGAPTWATVTSPVSDIELETITERAVAWLEALVTGTGGQRTVGSSV